MQGVSNQRLRVLCLDIEGGYGGSSRSLYESIRHLDRKAVSVEVWCKLAGPIQARYAELGVPCRIMPDLPKVSSLPNLSRNVIVYARALWEIWPARACRRELARTVNERFDLVHFNHEAFFLLARWLRKRVRVPFTMHIRTNLRDTVFARWQNRTIARVVDHLIFISENEHATFEQVGGGSTAHTIIYNIADSPDASVLPYPAVPPDQRLKIACLSNCAWVRGTDRLVEVAEILAAKGRRDILFVMAGHMALERSMPGLLGRIGRRGGTLADYATERGLGDMFLFLGHVQEPERVLVACDMLAKPTREDNPWGRDIIEAMAAARPVFTVGRWDGFVQDGRTGVLQATFDAKALAERIVHFANHRDELLAMGRAAQTHVARLCHGPSRAADLLDVWTKQARA